MPWPCRSPRSSDTSPPLVTGVVLTVIGISLIGVAGGLIVGNDPTSPVRSPTRRIWRWLPQSLWSRWPSSASAAGLWTQLGVLMALVIGTVIAIPMGLIDLSGVGGSAWVGLPDAVPLRRSGVSVTAVVAMSIVMAVVFAESTASMLAVSEITGKPLKKADLARGLVADGMSGVLGGIFNAFVDTVFSQNVGAVATTRVYSRYVTATSGAILIVLGLIPRMGEVVAALPDPVVGGVGIILFSTVAVVGINTLRKVDLSDPINTTIAAVSVGIGILPEFAEGMFERFPSSAQILLGSGITLLRPRAFSLNLLFNHTRLGELARRSRESLHATAKSEPATSSAGDASVHSPSLIPSKCPSSTSRLTCSVVPTRTRREWLPKSTMPVGL